MKTVSRYIPAGVRKERNRGLLAGRILPAGGLPEWLRHVVDIPTGRYYCLVLESRDRVADAVVFDYGGVLTTSLSATTGSWLSIDGVDPDGFATLMRDWLGRDAEPGNPIHLLETGKLAVTEFERRF